MNHLWAEGTTIHACEGDTVNGHYLVWTKCGRDVPANMSFRNDEQTNCSDCIQSEKGSDL